MGLCGSKEIGETDQLVDELLKKFRKYDTNNNGSIDASEFNDLAKDVPLDEDALKMALEEMDRDGGGTVTWNEFKTWFFKDPSKDDDDEEEEQDNKHDAEVQLTGDAEVDKAMLEEQRKAKERAAKPVDRRDCGNPDVQIIFDKFDLDLDDWWNHTDFNAFCKGTNSWNGEVDEATFIELCGQFGCDEEDGISGEAVAEAYDAGLLADKLEKHLEIVKAM